MNQMSSVSGFLSNTEHKHFQDGTARRHLSSSNKYVLSFISDVSKKQQVFTAMIETEVATRSQTCSHHQNKESQKPILEGSVNTSSDRAAGIISSSMLVTSIPTHAKLTEAGIKAATATSGSQSLEDDESRHDSLQWEVVESPEAAKTTQTGGVSSHFHIEVGWGKWKFILFSWDASISGFDGHDTDGQDEGSKGTDRR
jgi:hypothetical protein